MRRFCFCVVPALSLALLRAGEVKPAAELYSDYNPVFAEAQPPALMKVSQQPTFYNRASVCINNQACALIEEGIKQEAAGDFKTAIKHYQRILDKYSDSLLQVGAAGVFVPAAFCAQQRLLRFPPKELAYYRLLFDPRAREIYEGARDNHSQEGLQEIVDLFAATSYGATALFDLGNLSLDSGQWERAEEIFERIRDWYPSSDFDAWEVHYRLAIAARRLSHESTFNSAIANLEGDASPLRKMKRDGLKELVERGAVSEKNDHWPRISFSNYAPRAPLQTELSTGQAQWTINLPKATWPTAEDADSGGELRPFHMPWVVGNNLYFKHYNRIYCHSPIDGRLKWAFEIPPVDRDARRIITEFWSSGRWATNWYSQQDIAIDEDLLFATVRAYGDRESLVALDRVTGEMRWAIGSISPHDEADMQTRYDALPAVGRAAVFLPWTCDVGEGGSHIATAAGLTALDKHTGRILWKKELCQLQPSSTTQHRSGINLYSAQPLVHEGVVYHVTNAGTIAALDEVSGSLRWMIRYPHLWRPQSDSGNYFAEPVDAHDDPTIFHGGKPYWTPFFCNQAPLLRNGCLYVTPVDSMHLICLDAATGKVRWSALPANAKGTQVASQYVNAAIIGVTQHGQLALSSSELALFDMKTGKPDWTYTPTFHCTWSRANPKWEAGSDYPMMILGRPTLTADDHVSFSAYYPIWDYGLIGYHVAYGEWNISLADRKAEMQRIYFNPNFRNTIEAMLKGTVKDSKDAEKFKQMTGPEDVNAPFTYDPVKRLPLQFHGIPFEIRDNGQSLQTVFDPNALSTNVSTGASHLQLQAQAEILLSKGLEEQALAAFEKCRAAAGAENRDFLREVDRELYRLCQIRAWKSLLAGDLPLHHQYCVRMSETATTIGEELDANFALAESFERRGNFRRSVQCLQNIVRHYQGTTVAVHPGCRPACAAQTSALSDCVTAIGSSRPVAFQSEFARLEELSKKSLPAYLSVTAPVARDCKADASTLAVRNLQDLLQRHPDFQKDFDQMAQNALSNASPERLEALLRCYPATPSAQDVCDQLVRGAQALDAASCQRRLLKLSDEAALLGLKFSTGLPAWVRLAPDAGVPIAAAKSFIQKTLAIDDGGQNLRLLLKDRSPSSRSQNLVFIGGRARRRLDNKFSLECWDIEAWKEKFPAIKDIRLKDKGDEPGFDEALCGDADVVVHGRFDLFSFALEDGALRWQFRLPFDFDLQSVDRMGELIVASGSVQTLALQASSGQVVWEARDDGTLYHVPFFRNGMVVSVRREPYGVVFRALASGRLERILEMPELSIVTRHPVLAPDVTQEMVGDSAETAGLPIACDGDTLMLTDGSSYIAIDLKGLSIRWKRPIDNNDPLPGPMRIFIHEPQVLVLKRDHGTPSLHLLDGASGQLKWIAPPKDTVYSIAFDERGASFVGLAPPNAGRIGAQVRCFEIGSGKESWSWDWGGFAKRPDVAIEAITRAGQVILRDRCGDDFGLAILDPAQKDPLFRLKTQGVGGWREHGGKSVLIKDGSFVLLTEQRMTAGVPVCGEK